MANRRSLVAVGLSPQWCEPPCVLPALHHGDCWDGTFCGQCPVGCVYCSGSEGCGCVEDHREDDL